MRLVIITPVGPGHEGLAERAKESVRRAIANRDGFSDVRHVIVCDRDGLKGRSRARNEGMVPAEWYFFLDADDILRPDALALNNFKSPATFGAVSLNGSVYMRNVYPCGWKEIADRGAHGTLSMGFFCRSDVARNLRFNEEMDRGEDFDFYMRLPSFVKIDRPLVDIGYDKPSAGGPRGYREIDWTGICNRVVDEAVLSNPGKFRLGGHALLAAAGGFEAEPRALP